MSQHRSDGADRLEAVVRQQLADVLTRRRARAEADDALRSGALVGDVDRDGAVAVLNQAFAEGRLQPEEHADRVSRALAARTRADLDAVLVGLQLPAEPAPVRPAGRVVFWTVLVFTAPMLLTSLGMLLNGSFAGLVVLLLVGALLRRLHRRAWPRTP